jgi:hypothetical protein
VIILIRKYFSRNCFGSSLRFVDCCMCYLDEVGTAVTDFHIVREMNEDKFGAQC